MSRGVRDLRDLVMVSRLSYRDSGSDSDDSRGGMITPFEQLQLDDNDMVQYDKSSIKTGNICSPPPTPPSSADSGLGQRKRKKRKKPKGYMAESKAKSPESVARELHPFPRSTPLPAVGTQRQQSRPLSSSSTDSAVNTPSPIRTDFSDILDYLDENTVADWLQRANQSLKDLTIWCTDCNFVEFAQFWITEFGVQKRCEILELEHSILMDELTLAVQQGLELQKIQHKDITGLLDALLREYPKKLASPSGVYLLLDYLDIFTSERTLEYRQILADVKLSTANKHHVQLILASRSFMLINIWMAIINFYRQVHGHSNGVSTDTHLTKHREKLAINHSRILEAINSGLVEVVHYFLYSGKVSAGYVDSRQKSLLHIALAANKPKVVEYLLRKWTGCLDVNRPCDTGNTPLHVAVNIGNPKLVQLLLAMPDIDVNKQNLECDGATPFHLAVLHGNTEIVRLLLKYKADTKKLMLGQSVLEIANDFGHAEIIHLLVAITEEK